MKAWPSQHKDLLCFCPLPEIIPGIELEWNTDLIWKLDIDDIPKSYLLVHKCKWGNVIK